MDLTIQRRITLGVCALGVLTGCTTTSEWIFSGTISGGGAGGLTNAVAHPVGPTFASTTPAGERCAGFHFPPLQTAVFLFYPPQSVKQAGKSASPSFEMWLVRMPAAAREPAWWKLAESTPEQRLHTVGAERLDARIEVRWKCYQVAKVRVDAASGAAGRPAVNGEFVRKDRVEFEPALPVVALGMLVGVGFATPDIKPPRHYTDSDQFMKGQALVVPAEFRTGTASYEQARRWTKSLIGVPGEIASDWLDLDGDGKKELLLCNTGWAGTGGNSYLAFAATPKGYRYLGHLGFAGIRVLPPDGRGRPRLITSWHRSSGECGVSLVVLEKDGFTTIAGTTLRAGDSGTAEGNRIYDELFAAETVAEATLEKVFGRIP